MTHSGLARPAGLLMSLLTAGLLALTACSSAPRRPWTPVERREPEVDLLHYEIHVDLDHEAGYLQGQVGIEFRALPGEPVNHITLDAVGLDVRKAWDSQGRDLAVDVDAQTLKVHLAEPLPPGTAEIVVIDYEAFPRRGILFIPPGGDDPGRPWMVWSQGQSEDTRHWMPVWDLPNDRATHTLHITVDDRFTTLCAGELVDTLRDERNGRRTDTWRMDVPHSSYLTTLVAGGFATAELPGEGVPLPVLADPRLLDDAVRVSSDTRDMIALFEQVTGVPYPYAKYAQTYVEDFTAGGMENISATTLYEEGIHPRDAEPQVDIGTLLAHELAHQWYGDLLTNRSWGDVWLNEGMATYCELLWKEHADGLAAMQAELIADQRQAADEDADAPRPTVWHDYVDPDDTFDTHAYEGAAARIFLLRNQIGAEAFDRALRHYTAQHARGIVVTADFVDSFEEELGIDLGPFFDEWFYGEGFPVFAATVAGAPDDPSTPLLTVEQVQDELGMREVFHVAVAVSWSRGGVEHRAAMPFETRESTLRLAGEGDLDWVRFDADGVVPGREHLAQSPQRWASQLRAASDPVTRLVAAQWFARDGHVFDDTLDDASVSSAQLEALHQAALGDDFVEVRTAAVRAIGLLQREASVPTLMTLARDADARVRQAALGALATLGGDDVLLLIDAAVDDPNGGVCAAALSALVQRDIPEVFDRLVRRFHATDQLRLRRDLVNLAGSIGDARVLPFVIGVARSDPERWVRAAAVRVLGLDGWRFPDVVFRELCRSLSDASYEVRAAAADALREKGDARALIHLRARLDLEDDATVWKALADAIAALS
ncbi:MAG: HEAT repeat domain-containing protein [Planctomycetes bacterium]|nr:HEAT repeat domain-containing protein [Planctomycetota bacterium]